MIKNAKVAGSGVNSEEYHAQTEPRGSEKFAMSPSTIKTFAHCPSRWRDGYESPDSKAKANGNLFDCLLLTPEKFKLRYAIKPATYYDEKSGEDKPWNANSKVCKEWLADHADFEDVSQKEVDETHKAIERLRRDEVISKFLDASDKQVMVTAEWHDQGTGLVIPIRCLMDLVPRVGTEFEKSLGDIKTTRSAGLRKFQRDVYNLGYHIQAAFDIDLFVAATKEDRINWCFILQENYAPYQSGKRLLGQDFIELGRAEYARALTSYCACLKRNYWPDYDDNDEAIQGWSLIVPDPWMASEGQFAPQSTMPEEEADGENPPEVGGEAG